MRAILGLLIFLISATLADAQAFLPKCCNSPRCSMYRRALAAYNAGQTKVCFGGRCYSIWSFLQPTAEVTTTVRERPRSTVTRTKATGRLSVASPVISPPVAFDTTGFDLAPGERLLIDSIRTAPKKNKPVDFGTAFDPTPEDAARLGVALAQIQPSEIVYDLGCGDGRVLEYASPFAKECVGIEINPATVELAVKRTCNLRNVRIMRRDIFATDFSNADVVFTYLYPGMLRQLASRFAKLRPGARVVSYLHKIPGAVEHRFGDDIFYVLTISPKPITQTAAPARRSILGY